jgi:selenide,water dikinase
VVRPEGAAKSLVLTIDVITPIVDDARTFGAIAAANALSDVYAMGGKPEVALSFIGFPNDQLPADTLVEIARGLHDSCARAGCAIVGGHTVADTEPKCGLAVVGSVEPDRLWSHRSARPGDVLILTKPLGTGLIGHAVRAETATALQRDAAVRSMTMLNDAACAVGQQVAVTAATDVTGFGLLGHLGHIVKASALGATIDARRVPLLPGVVELAASGCVPGGTRRNLGYVEPWTRFDDAVDPNLRLVLADAQTSGGLLLCVPAPRADDALERLHHAGCPDAAVIGQLVASTEPQLHVR